MVTADKNSRAPSVSTNRTKSLFVNETVNTATVSLRGENSDVLDSSMSRYVRSGIREYS
jgi:hypothetical protein